MRALSSLITVVALVLVSCTSDSLPTNWSPVYDDPGIFGGQGDQWMSAVAAHGRGWIAVGYDTTGGDADAALWTSSDGLIWNRNARDEAVFGGDGEQTMGDVAVGTGRVVVVGTDTSGGDSDAAVWTSSDGVSWTRIPHDEATLGGDGEQAMLAVVVGGPGFVTVGSDASGGDGDIAVWTSPDGVTWTRVPPDPAIFGGDGDQWAADVAAGDLGVIAVGSDFRSGYGDAAVWTSADGLAWTRIANDDEVLGGPGAEYMWSVTTGGPGVVAVGSAWFGIDQYRAATWTSPDGATWTRTPEDPALTGSNGKATFMFGVAASSAGVVAVGYESTLGLDADPAVWTSPDGVTWSRFADPAGNLARSGVQAMAAVAVSPDGLVAVGRDGQPGYTETDAAVWVATRR